MEGIVFKIIITILFFICNGALGAERFGLARDYRDVELCAFSWSNEVVKALDQELVSIRLRYGDLKKKHSSFAGEKDGTIVNEERIFSLQSEMSRCYRKLKIPLALKEQIREFEREQTYYRGFFGRIAGAKNSLGLIYLPLLQTLTSQDDVLFIDENIKGMNAKELNKFIEKKASVVNEFEIHIVKTLKEKGFPRDEGAPFSAWGDLENEIKKRRDNLVNSAGSAQLTKFLESRDSADMAEVKVDREWLKEFRGLEELEEFAGFLRGKVILQNMEEFRVWLEKWQYARSMKALAVAERYFQSEKVKVKGAREAALVNPDSKTKRPIRR